MKKNSQKRRPGRGPLTPAQQPSARQAGSGRAISEDRHFGESEHKSVISNTLADSVSDVMEPPSNKMVAIYIATLAVLIAIGAVGGNDALKTATQKNIYWADAWAHYQGKSTRQNEYRLAKNQLQLTLAANPAMPEDAKKAMQAQIAQYDKSIACYDNYTPDCREGGEDKKARAPSATPAGQTPVEAAPTPSTASAEPKAGSEAANQANLNKAGKRQLTEIANAYAVERDLAYAQHPYFDYSQAMLQIAIVLASSSIIAGGWVLLIASGAVAAGGVLLLFNGFFLVWDFLGVIGG